MNKVKILGGVFFILGVIVILNSFALTGFSGDGIMNENGEIVPVTESMVVNAVNQVHSAWDATRSLKQAILR